MEDFVGAPLDTTCGNDDLIIFRPALVLCVVCCEREEDDCLVVERGRWREGFGGRERRYSTSTTTLVSIGVGASSSEKHYSG